MIDTPHPRTTPDVNQTVSDFDRAYEVARQALRHQRDFAVEFRILRPDGTVKYLEATGHPLFSTRGELFEVLATQVEVADRKGKDAIVNGCPDRPDKPKPQRAMRLREKHDVVDESVRKGEAVFDAKRDT